MSIEKRSGGAYRTDTVFPYVGRVRRALNTDNRKEALQRDALLAKLYKKSRYDLLRAFNDGRITIERLIEADNRESLGTTMVDLELDHGLWDAIEVALPNMGNTESTRARYKTSLLGSLRTKADKWLGPNADVAALARVDWKKLKDGWETSGTDWMQMRRAVSRFLSVLLDGKDHPFRRDVMKRFPTAKEKKRMPEWTAEQVERVISFAREDFHDFFWCAPLLGMRIGELIGVEERHLNEVMKSIHIPGTKTEDSEEIIRVDAELWPMVRRALPTKFSYHYIREVWSAAVAKAGYKDFHFHDLRHCHGQWAIDAGVAESKVQSSLRHVSPAMTRRYVARRNTAEVSAAVVGVIGRAKESVA